MTNNNEDNDSFNEEGFESDYGHDLEDSILMLDWALESVVALDWPTEPNPTVGMLPTDAVIILRGIKPGGTETLMMISSTGISMQRVKQMVNRAAVELRGM